MKGKGVKSGQYKPSKGSGADVYAPESQKVPHSFILNLTPISGNVNLLLKDFKNVMKPNTAENLKAKKRNTLKDFVVMSGPFNVSHLVLFSESSAGINMKMARLPQGPTLTFRLHNYSLIRDVVNTMKRTMTSAGVFAHAPCLMTNLQPTNKEKHLELCAKIFLDMFPTINPLAVKIGNLRRTVLIHYDSETSLFEFRHYAIRVRPRVESKAVKKLMTNKIPNLSRFNDISDFMTSEALSDSEAEEDTKNFVDYKEREKLPPQSVIKLMEIGPRLTMQLLKVEDGLCGGSVLYHSYITLTAEDKLEIKKKNESAVKLKEKRRRTQLANVKGKEEARKAHKLKCQRTSTQNPKVFISTEQQIEEDQEYYREEVGAEPEEGLFQKVVLDKEPAWKRKIFSEHTKLKRQKIEEKMEEKKSN